MTSTTCTPPTQLLDAIDQLRQNLNAALLGKPMVVEQLMACLLARAHVLIEDKPGLGKTTLAKALAESIGGVFARIQCTPDLLPGDITGFNIFNQQTREFEFQRGPVFADVLLADEINRATPRTQSALLEAMAEKQVTIDNVRHQLNDTFFVIATQNPVEHHGTYPLPEAQLDRFGMKLSIGYPDPSNEEKMLAQAIGHVHKKPKLEIQGMLLTTLQRAQEKVAGIQVQTNVQRYLIEISSKTRTHPKITLGLSPRGLLTWQRIAQAWAFLHQRDFVTPDDIQEVAHPVLRVRLDVQGSPANIIDELIQSVPVPN